jgi:hypothetical protein
MGVLVGVGMHHAVRVPVLVGVYVRMDVRVRVVMLHWICHRVFLLKSGSGDERQRRRPGLAGKPSRPSFGMPEFYAAAPERPSGVRPVAANPPQTVS